MLWVKQRGHDQFTTKKAIKFELQSNKWKILENNVFIVGKTNVECVTTLVCVVSIGNGEVLRASLDCTTI